MSSLNWAETGSRLRILKRDIEVSAEVLDNFFESEDGKESITMHKEAVDLNLTSRELELFRVNDEDIEGYEVVIILDAFPNDSERFKSIPISTEGVYKFSSSERLSSYSYLKVAASEAKMRPESAVNLVFDKLNELSDQLNRSLDEIGPAVEIGHPSGLLYF